MSYELHVLRAAADGVQPALLLRAPGKKAEYLFNVPDGFSRLAMEEKLVPSARLSCVLLTCLLPESTGGLGGLFLRLKQDGHGQMQLIGPQGSSSITHALRHICRWRHPKVFVSECCENGPIPVFEDEYIVIVPLLAGDQSTCCPWCLYATSETPTVKTLEEVPPATKSEEKNESSCADSAGSESSSSSDDTSSTGLVQSASNPVEDLFEKSLSAFNVCSEMGNDFLSHNNLDVCSEFNSDGSNGAMVDKVPHFFLKPSQGRDLKNNSYKGKRDRGHRALDSDEGFPGRIRLKKTKAEQDSGKVLGSSSGPTSNLSLNGGDDDGAVSSKEMASENSNFLSNSKASRLMDEEVALPAPACETELSNAVQDSFVDSTKHYEWLVSNSHQDDLPPLEGDSNPVYRRRPSTQDQVLSGGGIEKNRDNNGSGAGSPARVLGFVSYLRKLNKAILFVDCRGFEDLESLKTHPTLSCVRHTPGRVEGDEANLFSKMHDISAIVHLTPHSILQSSDYQLWMSMTRSPSHVVMNENSPEFGFKSSLAMLQRLNNIHQEIFPCPSNLDANSGDKLTRAFMNRDDSIADASLSMCLRFSEDGTTLSRRPVDHPLFPPSSEEISPSANNSEQVSEVPEVLFAKAEVPISDGNTYSHRSPNASAALEMKNKVLPQEVSKPSSGLSHSEDDVCKDINRIETKTTLLQGKETMLSQPSSVLTHTADDVCKDIDRDFKIDCEVATQVVLSDNQPPSLAQEMEFAKFYDEASEFHLVFLGTGCAEPSKNRGSSSILVQVRGSHGAMLLDAGEGAAGQVLRRFGEKAAQAIISSLQCVWLSHKHGDHVLGVLSILQTRSSQAPPLVIVGPHKVGQWLSEVWDTCSARGSPMPQFVYIHCDELSHSQQWRNNGQHAKQILGVLDAMLLKSILTVKVFHCYDSYGIVLSGRSGWKMVYSGDTRPCKQLIEAGQRCTVLIHEATFEDSLVEQAKSKRHSTVSEAVNVGRQMSAHHVILTHFSQRYPEMVTVSGDNKENLSLAFDGMVVPSQLLGSLGKLLPRIRIALQKTLSIPPITDTGGQRSEGFLKQMPIRYCEPGEKLKSERESLVAQHTRWSSDDEVPGKRPDGDFISTIVKWSSDSDEDAEFRQHGGLLKGNRSKESLDSFFVPSSSKGGRGTGLDSFIGMLGSSEVQREVSEENCGVCRPISNTKETAGPLGGKHLRWIDSDSEDE